jgi:NADH-quinone oxidoreductase subunit L
MSQIGFMFMACGLGAFQVAFFHLFTHAFFKACLFLGAGAVIHALHGEEDMRRMGGLAKKIPFTFATFLLASLALCGIPPFAGFFSKDEILWSAWSAAGGSPALWLVGSVTSCMTAFYMFRAIFLTFFGPCHVPEKAREGIHEPPPSMSIVLALLAFGSLAAGLIGLPGFWREILGVSAPFYDFLAPLPGLSGEGAVADHHAELVLMGVSVLAALLGISLAWLFFHRRRDWSLLARERAGILHAVLSSGYYLDTVYRGALVRPMDWLSESILARRVETTLHAGILTRPADGVHGAARLFSRLQSGNVKAYALYAFAGLAVILWWGVAHA